MSAPIELIKGGERQTLYSEAKVSIAIADGWQRVADLTPEQQRKLADLPPLPWKGYDTMNADDVIRQSAGLPPERIKEIVVYESATKGRVSIIGKLTGRVPVQSAPIPAANVERQLEAETGRDFVQTGTTPPTFVETDAPAP